MKAIALWRLGGVAAARSKTASLVYSVRIHRGGVVVPAPRRPQDDEPVPDLDANLAARWQG